MACKVATLNSLQIRTVWLWIGLLMPVDILLNTKWCSVLFASASEMSSDESEHEDEEAENLEEDHPGCRGSLKKAPLESPHSSERWEGGTTPEGSKPASVSGKSQDVVNAESTDLREAPKSTWVGGRGKHQEEEIWQCSWEDPERPIQS